MLPMRQKNEKTTPEWAKKAKQWSTPQEWEEFQKHQTDREKLQGEITKQDHLSEKQL